MNLKEKWQVRKIRYSRFRQLEQRSDEMIQKITGVDLSDLSLDWRKEAEQTLRDVYYSSGSDLSDVSSALIKLAFYSQVFSTMRDVRNHTRFVAAIMRLRASNEGLGIDSKASEFAYSLTGY
ncbi:MAG: hypothetical protein GKR91_17350 [Pseudomonadales bacterium]|nr:hypothetical protein [Pseudomonadales bacterium]